MSRALLVSQQFEKSMNQVLVESQITPPMPSLIEHGVKEPPVFLLKVLKGGFVQVIGSGNIWRGDDPEAVKNLYLRTLEITKLLDQRNCLWL